MNHCHVTNSWNGFQRPVNSKLVVVLAQASNHIKHVRTANQVLCIVYLRSSSRWKTGRWVLVLHNSDVMVSIIHAWSHEICHASINANIVLVDALLVNNTRHQPSAWTS